MIGSVADELVNLDELVDPVVLVDPLDSDVGPQRRAGKRTLSSGIVVVV